MTRGIAGDPSLTLTELANNDKVRAHVARGLGVHNQRHGGNLLDHRRLHADAAPRRLHGVPPWDDRSHAPNLGTALPRSRSIMKTLFLVRHAKSSRDDPSLPDRDRPLDDRGERDAPQMGKRLARRGVKPDLIVSSPARRALTTAQLVAEELGYAAGNIVVDDRLYASSQSRLLDVIRTLDDKLERVMLFGHNPEFTGLAHRLSGEITEMPTTAVAEFGFETKAWADVGRVEPTKALLEIPKK